MFFSTRPHAFPWQFVAALVIFLAALAYALWQQSGLCFTPREIRQSKQPVVKLKVFVVWWTGLLVTLLGLVFGVGPFLEDGMMSTESPPVMTSQGATGSGITHQNTTMTASRKMVCFAYVAFGLGTLLTMLLWEPPRGKSVAHRKHLQDRLRTYVPLALVFGVMLLLTAILQILTLSKCSGVGGVGGMGGMGGMGGVGGMGGMGGVGGAPSLPLATENNIGVAALNMLMALGLLVPAAWAVSV